MTKTEYLFGHPKERYGDHLVTIGSIRIEDGRKLLKELNKKITYDPAKQDAEQLNLRLRMRKIEEAISTWRKILELDED